jgi:26S proteasome regulatory subunit T5
MSNSQENSSSWDKLVEEELKSMSTEAIISRTRAIDNEIKIYKNELSRLTHEQNNTQEKIKDNQEKLKLNKQLPYLVANVVEVGVEIKSF